MESADRGNDQNTSHDIAIWTHMWAGAASRALEAIDKRWDPEDPVGTIGGRDVLALMLIDALRNVYRGASAVLGRKSEDIRLFEREVPKLKEVRDTLEHFDSYLKGEGHRQENCAPVGVPRVSLSSEGSLGGHALVLSVATDGVEQEEFRVESKAAVQAGRKLTLSVMTRLGLDDERHRERCLECAQCR